MNVKYIFHIHLHIILFHNIEHKFPAKNPPYRPSSILRSIDWQLVNDVSEQPICPFFRSQEVQGNLSRNVGNNQSTLRNIPEERRSHLHRGRSLKSHHQRINKSTYSVAYYIPSRN